MNFSMVSNVFVYQDIKELIVCVEILHVQQIKLSMVLIVFVFKDIKE